MTLEPDILLSQAKLAQQAASNPNVSAWVGASAGSGKTKVLIDRILRLLLASVKPETILCLTYTKAAAAEMENRLKQIVRKWVIMDDDALKEQLIELVGNQIGDIDDLMAFSRTLFARLLQVKGGFQMMTIHSFCESLLRRFPLESGVSPSFEIIEETQSKFLLKNTFYKIVSQPQYEQDLFVLSEYVSEKTLFELLENVQKDQSKMEQLLSYMSFESLKDKIYATLGVHLADTEEKFQKDAFPDDDFDALKKKYLTKSGTILADIQNAGGQPLEEAKKILSVIEKINALHISKATCALLHIMLEVFKQFSLIKQNKGVLDYADLIEKTNNLLSSNASTAWVLYKLDGGIDHILLDEAQDTSPEQWQIIKAITEEFFSGNGHKENKLRTLFVVGDKKQSIYRFQGADAREFEKMHQYFATRIRESKNQFEDVRLNISFRSTQPVLDVVNMVLSNPMARIGVALPDENVNHIAYRAGYAGLVEIWPLEVPDKDKISQDIWQVNDFTEKTVACVRTLSVKIADKIRDMLDKKEVLPSVGRPIKPSDIMILVRSRKRQGIVDELIKALKEKNIPVSGMDRLILNKHIAIQDLISLGSFLLLPDDDLSLAEVLKSPIFDLSEEQLQDISVNRENKTLWSNVAVKDEKIYLFLKDLLSKTDVLPPFELYSYVLDVLGIRAKFLSRLGNETGEMLDEFLNVCLKFEQNNTPSLEGFLQFIKKDEIEIKRDLDNGQTDVVRIMTVHGSKGLQSKIVFLPDSYSKNMPLPNFFWKNGLPLWVPSSDMRTTVCKEALRDILSAENDEYNRLLYVAMTRAEDRLYVCGFATSKNPPENNWYDMIANSVRSYTPFEGAMLVSAQTCESKSEKLSEKSERYITKLPEWFDEPALAEPIPSKPLSPSKLSEDTAAPSPLTPEQEQAMARGSLIHKLLQYLPEVPEKERKEFILKNTPSDMQLPAHLLDLFDNPAFCNLFGVHSKAEVPLVGITDDGKVISGQIDRLVVNKDEVLIVDYKTNRYPPKTPDDVPLAYKEQINAYKGLLKNLFPDKRIRGFVLWTTDLTMMEI